MLSHCRLFIRILSNEGKFPKKGVFPFYYDLSINHPDGTPKIISTIDTIDILRRLKCFSQERTFIQISVNKAIFFYSEYVPIRDKFVWREFKAYLFINPKGFFPSLFQTQQVNHISPKKAKATEVTTLFFKIRKLFL